MKKLALWAVLFLGLSHEIKADNYYLGADMSDGQGWTIKSQFTDEDNDGTYTCVLDLVSANANTNIIFMTVFTSNNDIWNHDLRPANDISITGTNGSLSINLNGSHGNNKTVKFNPTESVACSLLLEFTPSNNNLLQVTKRIDIVCQDNNWTDDVDFLTSNTTSEEYTGSLTIRTKDELTHEYAYKYRATKKNRVVEWWGKKSDGYLTDTDGYEYNMTVEQPGIYQFSADFNTYVYGEPVKVSEEITIPASGYSTYVNTKALNFANISGLTAYTASDEGDGNALLTPISSPAPGTAMLLKGTGGELYIIPTVEGSASPAINNNALKAGTGTSVPSEEGNYKNYILSNGAFYLAGGKTIPTNKAYLQLTKTSSSAMPQLIFADESLVPTSIQVVETVLTESRCFNAQGIRVSKPGKGLYIIDGRKQIVK